MRDMFGSIKNKSTAINMIVHGLGERLKGNVLSREFIIC